MLTITRQTKRCSRLLSGLQQRGNVLNHCKVAYITLELQLACYVSVSPPVSRSLVDDALCVYEQTRAFIHRLILRREFSLTNYNCVTWPVITWQRKRTIFYTLAVVVAKLYLSILCRQEIMNIGKGIYYISIEML